MCYYLALFPNLFASGNAIPHVNNTALQIRLKVITLLQTKVLTDFQHLNEKPFVML